MGVIVIGMGLVAGERSPLLMSCVVALIMFLVASMFVWMTVRDEGESLAVRYGPLPVFRARFRYRDISDVQAGRSTLLDGWGIHYVPFRGWTYNLWGLDCVKMRVNGTIVRIGSDDVAKLVEFLQAKIATL
jgi:hypothetical protein